jgi:signal transduction histidine kinase
MRERAALLGGAVQLESAPGKGTMITARFPVPRS